MENIRLIEKFLKDELNAEERSKFLSDLRNNDELKQHVEFHKEINESILDVETIEFREQLKGLLSTNKRSFGKRHLAILSGVAALIIFVFSLANVLNNPDLQHAYNIYYKPYDSDFLIRSGDKSNSNIEKAYLLYQKGEYKTGYNLLSNYLEDNPNDYIAEYYYGLCAIELGNYNVAERSFQKVIQDCVSPYNLHAQWYLSLTYLKINDYKQAKPLLLNLAKDPYYASKAKKILRKYFD
jgi:TolA-binding protein